LQFFSIVVILICHFFIGAGLVLGLNDLVPNSFSLEHLNFVDALYFMIVTFSTLGYGDILPITSVSRILIWLGLFLLLIIVSDQLTKLANLLKFWGPGIEPFTGKNHFIIIADDTINIDLFLNSLANNLGKKGDFIIISKDIKPFSFSYYPYNHTKLINSRNVDLELLDLINYKEASAIFIFTTKKLNNYAQYEKITDFYLMKLTSNHLTSNSMTYVQSLISENTLFNSAVINEENKLKFHSKVVPIWNIKTSIISKASFNPGFNVFIQNLLFNNNPRPYNFEDYSDLMQFYIAGTQNKIFKKKIPRFFYNRDFFDVMYIIYLRSINDYFVKISNGRKNLSPILLIGVYEIEINSNKENGKEKEKDKKSFENYNYKKEDIKIFPNNYEFNENSIGIFMTATKQEEINEILDEFDFMEDFDISENNQNNMNSLVVNITNNNKNNNNKKENNLASNISKILGFISPEKNNHSIGNITGMSIINNMNENNNGKTNSKKASSIFYKSLFNNPKKFSLFDNNYNNENENENNINKNNDDIYFKNEENQKIDNTKDNNGNTINNNNININMNFNLNNNTQFLMNSKNLNINLNLNMNANRNINTNINDDNIYPVCKTEQNIINNKVNNSILPNYACTISLLDESNNNSNRKNARFFNKKNSMDLKDKKNLDIYDTKNNTNKNKNDYNYNIINENEDEFENTNQNNFNINNNNNLNENTNIENIKSKILRKKQIRKSTTKDKINYNFLEVGDSDKDNNIHHINHMRDINDKNEIKYNALKNKLCKEYKIDNNNNNDNNNENENEKENQILKRKRNSIRNFNINFKGIFERVEIQKGKFFSNENTQHNLNLLDKIESEHLYVISNEGLNKFANFYYKKNIDGPEILKEFIGEKIVEHKIYDIEKIDISPIFKGHIIIIGYQDNLDALLRILFSFHNREICIISRLPEDDIKITKLLLQYRNLFYLKGQADNPMNLINAGLNNTFMVIFLVENISNKTSEDMDNILIYKIIDFFFKTNIIFELWDIKNTKFLGYNPLDNKGVSEKNEFLHPLFSSGKLLYTSYLDTIVSSYHTNKLHTDVCLKLIKVGEKSKEHIKTKLEKNKKKENEKYGRPIYLTIDIPNQYIDKEYYMLIDDLMRLNPPALTLGIYVTKPLDYLYIRSAGKVEIDNKKNGEIINIETSHKKKLVNSIELNKVDYGFFSKYDIIKDISYNDKIVIDQMELSKSFMPIFITNPPPDFIITRDCKIMILYQMPKDDKKEKKNSTVLNLKNLFGESNFKHKISKANLRHREEKILLYQKILKTKIMKRINDQYMAIDKQINMNMNMNMNN
jgi:hypothetical protein